MKPAADDDGSLRRRHHFDPRSRAARDGRRLPPLEKPLLDMLFLGNDLAPDAQGWAEILLPRLPGTGGDGTPPAAGMDGGPAWPAKNQFRRMRTGQALLEHVVGLRTTVAQ